MMPGMDGIETAGKIRKLGTGNAETVPIIALTANAIAGSEEMFLSKGFAGFLSKPIDLIKLDAAIRRWVRDESMEFHIKGVDVNAGIERFGGDGDAYKQVLRSFAANTRELLGTIGEISREDLGGYAITVHGIKGSCRSICAETAGEMAMVLETAAKEDDFTTVTEKNPAFIQTVKKLLDDIDAVLETAARKNEQPAKPAPDQDLLDKILEGCKVFDMETVENSIKELERYSYESDGEIVPWLWENARQFNLNGIIEKLSERRGLS
jgi:HPt (histidine-containing phosphotransfer) domain-containing protein